MSYFAAGAFCLQQTLGLGCSIVLPMQLGFFSSVLSLHQQRSLRFQSLSVIRKNSLNPDFKQEATNLLCKQRA